MLQLGCELQASSCWWCWRRHHSGLVSSALKLLIVGLRLPLLQVLLALLLPLLLQLLIGGSSSLQCSRLGRAVA